MAFQCLSSLPVYDYGKRKGRCSIPIDDAFHFRHYQFPALLWECKCRIKQFSIDLMATCLNSPDEPREETLSFNKSEDE